MQSSRCWICKVRNGRRHPSIDETYASSIAPQVLPRRRASPVRHARSKTSFALHEQNTMQIYLSLIDFAGYAPEPACVRYKCGLRELHVNSRASSRSVPSFTIAQDDFSCRVRSGGRSCSYLGLLSAPGAAYVPAGQVLGRRRREVSHWWIHINTSAWVATFSVLILKVPRFHGARRAASVHTAEMNWLSCLKLKLVRTTCMEWKRKLWRPLSPGLQKRLFRRRRHNCYNAAHCQLESMHSSNMFACRVSLTDQTIHVGQARRQQHRASLRFFPTWHRPCDVTRMQMVFANERAAPQVPPLGLSSISHAP